VNTPVTCQLTDTIPGRWRPHDCAGPAEITDTIGDEPARPRPATIERLGAYLHDILDAGTPAQRKAAIEALIAEIRITEEGLIPVFRIPGPAPSQEKPAQPAPARSRFAQWFDRWAGRTSMRTAESWLKALPCR
jgi:hypothetical protein